VWGPSAKLLAENEELQGDVKAMQEEGVLRELCQQLRSGRRLEGIGHRCQANGRAAE
jgi:hypothetical protein